MKDLKLFYYLVENTSKNKSEFPFTFIATYSTSENPTERPIKYALAELSKDKRLIDLLAFVDCEKRKQTVIANLIKQDIFFCPCALDIEEAYSFINEVNEYKKNVEVRLPKWKQAKKIEVTPEFTKNGVSLGVTNFDLSVFIEKQKFTQGQLEKLVENNEPLALIKGKWIKLDKNQIQKTLLAIENIKKTVEEKEILDANTEIDKIQSDAAENSIEIKIDNLFWIQMLDKKLSQKRINDIDLKDINADLEDFQLSGVKWLANMKNIGLGGLLCDGCGLGKTLQVISLLSMEMKKEKTLIVVPATLLGNWGLEFNKFLPKLKFYILHKSFNKDLTPIKIENFKSYDVFITTYDYVKNYTWLQEFKWNNLILDEAQAIKNSTTQRYAALNNVKSQWRLCVTATPLENNLKELFNLVNFICPNLLGSCSDFIKMDKEIIKKIVKHLMLRRMNNVIKLPKKNIINVPIDMSVKQISLYSNLIDKIKAKTISILPAIIKLRQILDHPDIYLGTKQFALEDSYKMQKLLEIAQETQKRGDKMIIFVQFIELIDPLIKLLNAVFDKNGAKIDGSMAGKERTKVVKQFQDGNIDFLVCSLRAANSGLNLVSANVCVFYDLCYNPSVELQAYHRIYRILQVKEVFIYRFIVEGSIEEGINNLLEYKKELFNSVIVDANDEMIDKSFIELFKKELLAS